MAYTALQLITKSYYLSQVVARNLETVTGEQIADGLDLLNALLDVKGSDLRLIPYFQRYSFPTVAGQEEYFIPNLLQIDAMTFNIGDVRYPMKEMSRRQYFDSGRVDDVQSLPFTFRQERELGGTRIYMYFLPAGVYVAKISGKFGLTDVMLTQDMSLTYDLYYMEYLRFALAEYICSEYGATFPDQSAAKLAQITKKLMDINPVDLMVRKSSYFNSNNAIDWQLISIPGWIPS